MLHLEFDGPVVIARAPGPLEPLEATHHYCNAGHGADGSLIAHMSLHPDRARPAGSRVPIQRPGATHPVYLFRPHENHPDYAWPHEYASSRSTDGGRTWFEPVPTEGHNAVAVGDLTLAQPWWFPVLFRSTDGGFNFDYVSMPCGSDKPDGSHGYTEPALTRLPNGDLLAISRVEYHDPMRVMMQFRSSDDGHTWTTPEICPGVPPVYPVRKIPVVNDGKTHLNAVAVSPELAVLPNGVVVLTYGRPGQYLAFSEDGTGTQWRDRIAVVPEHSLFRCQRRQFGHGGRHSNQR